MTRSDSRTNYADTLPAREIDCRPTAWPLVLLLDSPDVRGPPPACPAAFSLRCWPRPSVGGFEKFFLTRMKRRDVVPDKPRVTAEPVGDRVPVAADHLRACFRPHISGVGWCEWGMGGSVAWHCWVGTTTDAGDLVSDHLLARRIRAVAGARIGTALRFSCGPLRVAVLLHGSFHARRRLSRVRLFARRPILLGGMIAPVFGRGLL